MVLKFAATNVLDDKFHVNALNLEAGFRPVLVDPDFDHVSKHAHRNMVVDRSCQPHLVLVVRVSEVQVIDEALVDDELLVH